MSNPKELAGRRLLLAVTLTLSALVCASSAFAQSAGGGNGGGGGGGGGPGGGGAEVTIQMNVQPAAVPPEYFPVFVAPPPTEPCRFQERRTASGQRCQ